MGLLKSIVSDAVSKGIKKGISDAVGKAVEDIVKPSVDNLAQKQADKINATTKDLEQATAEARQATTEAAKEISSQASAAPASAGGLASLEAALGGWAKRAESMATEMSKNLKECPQCGEMCSSDKQFCPKCGAKLPETTVGQAYTCSKCGEVNTIGTKYCCKCGALLPAAEAEVKAKAAADAVVLSEFKEKLPMYPEWSVGGYNLRFTTAGTSYGHPRYEFVFEGPATISILYVQKLREAGFDYRDGLSSSGMLYKIVDGVARCCNIEKDSDGDTYWAYFFVDNSLLPKKAEQEVTNLAKGIFKKFF